MTREDIIQSIDADTRTWEALDNRQQVDWLTEYARTSHNDGLRTIIHAWEDHCAEAGHVPASRGGTATYASNHAKTGAVCRVDGCTWYVAAL